MTTTTMASDAERPVEPTPELPAVIQPPAPARLRWRVVVRTGEEGKMDPSRPSRPLAWHLSTCDGNELPAAHCPKGSRLVASGEDPDGHCLLDGVCPRCKSQE